MTRNAVIPLAPILAACLSLALSPGTSARARAL